MQTMNVAIYSTAYEVGAWKNLRVGMYTGILADPPIN